MEKILLDTDDDTDYFYRNNPIEYHTFNNNFNLMDSDANLNFINVIMIMCPDKIAPFRALYHANLQQLPLPSSLLKKLEDYCPTDDDLYNHYGKLVMASDEVWFQ